MNPFWSIVGYSTNVAYLRINPCIIWMFLVYILASGKQEQCINVYFVLFSMYFLIFGVFRLLYRPQWLCDKWLYMINGMNSLIYTDFYIDTSKQNIIPCELLNWTANPFQCWLCPNVFCPNYPHIDLFQQLLFLQIMKFKTTNLQWKWLIPNPDLLYSLSGTSQYLTIKTESGTSNDCNLVVIYHDTHVCSKKPMIENIQFDSNLLSCSFIASILQ